MKSGWSVTAAGSEGSSVPSDTHKRVQVVLSFLISLTDAQVFNREKVELVMMSECKTHFNISVKRSTLSLTGLDSPAS